MQHTSSRWKATWFVVILVVGTLASRWPFRTRYLFDWDTANFALALDAYDVTAHRPHPPGYPLFVAGAYLARLVLGDANAALVAMALLLSTAAVVALYRLGRLMYGEVVGRWAALLLLGSVSFWASGCIGLTYPALALAGTLVVLHAYRILVLRKNAVFPLAASYALGGGLRPDLLLFLAPLVGVCLVCMPWRRRVLALAVGGIGCLAWLGPAVALSGGPVAYLMALASYVDADVLDRYSGPRLGLAAVVANAELTLRYTAYALYAIALLLPGAVLGWLALLRAGRTAVERRSLLVVLLWIVPMLLFYTTIHIGHVGYVFSFLPALLLLVARGWAALPLPSRSPSVRWTLLTAGVGLVLVANTAVFLFHPRLLTAQGLRLHDAAIAARLAAVRQYAEPGHTVVASYESYRQLAYYVPEFEQRLWIDAASPREHAYLLPATARALFLADTSLVALAERLPGTIIALPGNEQAKMVPLPRGSAQVTLVYRPGALDLEVARAGAR